MKKIIVLFVLFFFLFPAVLMHSCGPGFPSFYGYSFIDHKIIPRNIPHAPFILRFEDFFNALPDSPSIQISDNIAEWQERTCPDARKEDIEQIIYKTPIRQVELIKTAAQSETVRLPAKLVNNSFAKFLVRKKCLETIDYLVFAKKCEPHVIASSGWETPQRDTIAMQRLIEQGRKQFKKTKSHYIRLRYAFQLIRLAHYKKNYQQVLDLHTYLLPKTDAHPSILDYWIMGHHAGALRSMGKHVEASYLYSLIFQHSPSKRESAFQSFLIKNDDEWQACLLLCQNDKERAILYTIRANADESKAAEEMEKIYELDPDNRNLVLLLIKEMRKLEKDYLGLDFNINKRENRRYHKIPRGQSPHYLIRVQELVRRVLEEKKVSDNQIWLVADAYLKFLAGDFYAADKTFQSIQPLLENEDLKAQVDVFQLALKINRLEDVDEEDENELSQIIRSNDYYKKYPDFHNFLFDKLAQDYTENGQVGKAFRTLHPVEDLHYNLPLDVIDALLELCDKEEPSKLEKALIAKEGGGTIKNDLLDMKGTFYMTRFQLEAALETFKEIPRAERDTTELHPYRDKILDCVGCTQRDTMSFTKTTLVEKMLDLNYQARADLQLGAKAFYDLGLIYYNLSYYGNCWKGMDYFRSGSNWGYTNDKDVYSLYDTPYGNHENKDLSQALFYFEKARLLTKNKELAARATFMAAKCQHNAWYNHPKNKRSAYSNKVPDFPAEYQTYFDLLKSDYQDTEFYGEAIKECLYFRVYALR